MKYCGDVKEDEMSRNKRKHEKLKSIKNTQIYGMEE